MAAVAELVLTDVVVVDEDGFLAVEFLRNHKELLCGILFLRFVLSQERNQPSPSFLPLIIILALQFIKVFLSKQDGLLTQRLEEILPVLLLVEYGQLVCDGSSILNIILFKELV